MPLFSQILTDQHQGWQIQLPELPESYIFWSGQVHIVIEVARGQADFLFACQQ